MGLESSRLKPSASDRALGRSPIGVDLEGVKDVASSTSRLRLGARERNRSRKAGLTEDLGLELSGISGGDCSSGILSGSLGGVLNGDILSSSCSAPKTGAAKLSLTFLAVGGV